MIEAKRSKHYDWPDVIFVLLVGIGMPTYYKVKYLLDGFLVYRDLLIPEAALEYVFSFTLAVLLVWLNGAFRRRFLQGAGRKAALLQLALLTGTSIVAAVGFSVFFFQVVYPVGAPPSFFLDTAILAIFVPFLLSGLSDRLFFVSATQNALSEAEHQEQAALAAQYEVLKSRLSPHFLFNSLNTLTDLVESEPDLAVRFIENMSHTYRYILEKRDVPLVPLKEELDAVQALVDLLNVRHPDAIALSINIDASGQRAALVPLALQTLIENALKHNRYSAEHPLGIRVTATESILSVENDLRPKQSTASLGSGLENLKKRVLQVTGQQIFIKQNQDAFEVVVPLVREGTA